MSSPAHGFDQLVDIDVAPLFCDDPAGRSTVVERVAAACMQTGFFAIHNTCISEVLVADTLTHMRRFFALADAAPIKQAARRDRTPGGAGWGPRFTEPAYQAGTRADMESFDAGPGIDRFPSAEAAAAFGIWPIPWPELPGFRAAVERYRHAANQLGRALADVFAEMLDLEPGFFNRRSGVRAPKTLRLLHYPAAGPVVADRAHGHPPVETSRTDLREVGIAAHTDFECFTIMYQTAPGLELRNTRGMWQPMPVLPGRFTIILGDMMERLTNGHLVATGHRVARTAWQRHAIILFYALDGDYVVAPLPRFVGPDNPPRYPPVGQYAHIKAEIARATAHQ